MGRWQQRAAWRTTQDPLLRAPSHKKCLVGMSPADVFKLKGRILSGKVPGKILAQVFFINQGCKLLHSIPFLWLMGKLAQHIPRQSSLVNFVRSIDDMDCTTIDP